MSARDDAFNLGGLMHRALYLLPLALLLAPLEAFACINSMYRDVTEQIATQPLEFVNFGVFFAALVLLRWRGQPRKDEMWNADAVLGEDELLPEEERVERAQKREKPEPSMVRQVAILAVCVLASFGIGLFAADALAFTDTKLTTRAFWGLGLLSFGLSTSLFRTGSNFLVAVRRVFLALALVFAFSSAQSVWEGEITVSEEVPGFQNANADVQHQVTF